jgi:hypothetical protein
MDRAVAGDLRPIPSIRTVPYRQFGSNKDVLKAKFDMRLAACLPERLHDVLRSSNGTDAAERLDTVQVV